VCPCSKRVCFRFLPGINVDYGCSLILHDKYQCFSFHLCWNVAIRTRSNHRTFELRSEPCGLEQRFTNDLFCHARNLVSCLKPAKDMKCSFPKLSTENRHNEIGVKADHGKGGRCTVMTGISKFSSVILLGTRRHKSLFDQPNRRDSD
jgi:hypothetical protein